MPRTTVDVSFTDFECELQRLANDISHHAPMNETEHYLALALLAARKHGNEDVVACLEMSLADIVVWHEADRDAERS
jgi:hypothetical protein